MELCKNIEITDTTLIHMACGIEQLANDLMVMTTYEKEGIFKLDESATREQNAYAWLDKNYGVIAGAVLLISSASHIIADAMCEGLGELICRGLSESDLAGWWVKDDGKK